jgi:hypothetical protein
MIGDPGTPSPSSAAGWYPDPELSGMERYFDGTLWTQQTRPATPDMVAKTSSRKGWIIAGSIAAGVVLVSLIAGVAISVNSGLDPTAAEVDMAVEAGFWQVADQDGTGYAPLFTQVLTDTAVPMADGTAWGGRNFYEVPATSVTPWVLVYDGYVELQ